MSELIRLELKYCERCGGLLLRRAGLNVNFCRPCRETEQFPFLERHFASRPDRRRRLAVVLPFPPSSDRPGRLPDLQARCEGEQA